MIIYYTLATPQAIYEFQVNQEQARVTRWIRKGQKGYDMSSSMSAEHARKLARRLQPAK
jgi:hypothetical protein